MAKTTKTSKTEWEIRQLVRTRLFPDEGDKRHPGDRRHPEAVLRSALRALFQAQPELRRQMVIRAYTAGDISIGKAAEMMGISHEEMKEVLTESGAEIHLGPRTVDEVLRDAENA
jgi:predicted HTH domain antitoxin